MAVYDGRLFLNGDDGVGNGVELWSYDGTNPPVLAADVWAGIDDSYPAFLCQFNGKLYFRANGGDYKGTELWSFDSSTSTATLHNLNTAYASGSWPRYMTIYNGAMYFSAQRSNEGRELWSFNGTDSPSVACDINPGNSDSDPSCLCLFNDMIYFTADTGSTQLWYFDETEAHQVSSLPADYDPAYLTVFNGEIIFSAGKSGAGNGVEMWAYDGNSEPYEKFDIIEGEDSSSPGHFKVFNGKLFFQAFDADHGEEIWCYDGKSVPCRISDIVAGTTGSKPESFTVFDNKLYFSVPNSSFQRKLWLLYIK